MKEDWFEVWFNSPYYSYLYAHRDQNEARQFISKLIDWLRPHPNTTFLDAACGNGRHARMIHQLGFTVHGFDLSERQINLAKAEPEPNLSFSVRDIRTPFSTPQFNVVLNIFTSFGYFNQPKDHTLAMSSLASAILPNGFLIIDYLNPLPLIQELKYQKPKTQTILKENIVFNVRKYIENQTVVKEINVSHNQKTHQYEERVHLFYPEDLSTLAQNAGLIPNTCFGDYLLNPFTSNSPRQIHVFSKPHSL
jgi:SAM-dependent methyltransferase